MRIFQLLFYIYFLTYLRHNDWESKSDYTFFNAIFPGLFFSIFLSLNIWTVLIVLGFNDMIKIIVGNLGFWKFFPFLFTPIIFVYFSCIYKKKYLEIVERFKHWDKNWKSRLLMVLIGFLYMGGTVALLGLSIYFFVGFE